MSHVTRSTIGGEVLKHSLLKKSRHTDKQRFVPGRNDDTSVEIAVGVSTVSDPFNFVGVPFIYAIKTKMILVIIYLFRTEDECPKY
jgi:hypothetical protein